MKRNCLILLFCLSLLFQNGYSQQVQIALETFATGLTRPLDIAFPPNDRRMFVVEQRGLIKIVDTTGIVKPIPFLSITDRINSSGNEQGLLGMVFHPDYPRTPWFFVNYTNRQGDTHISKFKVSPTDPNIADPSSEVVLLFVDQPRSNHNAGDLNFGPDGYLYFGLGDGGGAGDMWNNAQTDTTLLGKMIRIDVSNDSLYSIPVDNPFVNDTAYLPEIWAKGLRNPWKFSFDRKNGDMWIADVGQNDWEEINFQSANSTGGENYGWRCYEGFDTYNLANCGPDSIFTDPVHVYPHQNQDCSVTGGYVYKGCDYPLLYGSYLYSDYCSGRIWALSACDTCPSGWRNRELLNFTNQELGTFGEDNNGEIWIAGLSSGRVYRLVERNLKFEAPEITWDGITLNVPGTFLHYQWYWNGSLLPTDTVAEMMPKDTGWYTVQVETINGCLTTATPFRVDSIITSVTEAFSKNFRISPNPFNTNIQIEILQPTAITDIRLFDLQGNRYEINWNTRNTQQCIITPSPLPGGIYFLNILSDHGYHTIKVLKQ